MNLLSFDRVSSNRVTKFDPFNVLIILKKRVSDIICSTHFEFSTKGLAIAMDIKTALVDPIAYCFICLEQLRNHW